MNERYLSTGQTSCHDIHGDTVRCAESGQDGEFGAGCPWPKPRFETHDDIVLDRLTDLSWTRCANLAEFPLAWQEALDFVADMNKRETFGFSDWRMPNRRELRSLMSYQTRKPALPEEHPYTQVFLGWYWTSTSAAISPAHAWYVHMEGARMFYGGKDQLYLLWPVRGAGKKLLSSTGQNRCFDTNGREIDCGGTGQDADTRMGGQWITPRFVAENKMIPDRLTNINWLRHASLTPDSVTWEGALDAVASLNQSQRDIARWRLPNINELESLVDCSAHSPALPKDHLFEAVQPAYWSSTTSAFEPDWAWALYLEKGALGVGQKNGRHFYVWAVCDAVPYTQS